MGTGVGVSGVCGWVIVAFGAGRGRSGRWGSLSRFGDCLAVGAGVPAAASIQRRPVLMRAPIECQRSSLARGTRSVGPSLRWCRSCRPSDGRSSVGGLGLQITKGSLPAPCLQSSDCAAWWIGVLLCVLLGHRGFYLLLPHFLIGCDSSYYQDCQDAQRVRDDVKRIKRFPCLKCVYPAYYEGWQ